MSVVATAHEFPLHRIRNVGIVLLAVGLGVTVPQAAHLVESLTLVIVTFLMYTSLRGTSITPAGVLSFVLPVLAVVIITYVVIPVVGISSARYLLSGGSLLGVAAVLSAPATAGSAIIWTRNSRGNDELSGLTSASTIVLAPLLTPLVLSHLMDQRVDLPVAKLEVELLLILGASIVLLLVVPSRIVSDRSIDVGSEASILLLIYAGVGTAGFAGLSAALIVYVGIVTLAVFAGGFGAALVAATLLGRERDDYLAIFFSGTLKNLGIALLIALSFAGDEVLLTVIVYYVFQQLFSAVIVDGPLFVRGTSTG